MATGRVIPPMLGLCTALLVLAALYAAQSILAPVAFALFAIAIVWPLQRALKAKMPAGLALVITLIVAVTVISALGWLAVWGFGTVGEWAIDNSGRLQTLYRRWAVLLEQQGLYSAGLLAETFDMMWLLRALGDVAGHLREIISFTGITLVFMILGLLEVPVVARRLRSLQQPVCGQTVLHTCTSIARKFQKYMLVRTLMSAITGLGVWGFASLAGLQLAREWGVIAFVLNYIPFIGPLVATALPALFAIAQFESWQMPVVVFAGLYALQFLTGSYIEPLIAGKALAASPFMVLFAVFFGTFLWGIPGAFIGVPILIALVTICENVAALRWIAGLLSGPPSAAG